MSMSPGKSVEYASKVLLPSKRFSEYLQTLDAVFDDEIHYIDPVHELTGKRNTLQMLGKVISRVANDSFQFELLHEDNERIFWKWAIGIRIRFTPFHFIIHGLVEAKVRKGKIYYQREFYDPMESIGVIPIIGFLYKMILRFG